MLLESVGTPPSGASLLSPHPTSPGHQSVRLSSLCYTATSHQMTILHMVVYICRCYFLHLSHSFLPHNGILLSHKKNEFESALMRWMNLDPVIQTELS